MKTKELSDAYQVLQEASGLKVGDRVKIVRELPDYSLGWGTCWNSYMTAALGKEGVISAIHATNGFRLSPFDYWFPVFSLELIKPVFIPKKFVLSTDYTAEVTENGTVVVGCQRIKPELMKQIMAAVDEALRLINKTEGYIPERYDAEVRVRILRSITANQYILKKGEQLKDGDRLYNDSGGSTLTGKIGCEVGSPGADYVYVRTKS